MAKILYKVRQPLSILMFFTGVAVALMDGITSPLGFVTAGMTLVILGAAVRFWGATYVKSHIASGQPTFEGLITSGPYAYTRNPIYLGTIVSGIGFGIAFASPWAILSYSIPISIYYYWLAKYEESTLTLTFGETYERCRCEVPLLFPRSTAAKVPGISIRPDVWTALRYEPATPGIVLFTVLSIWMDYVIF